MYQQRKTPSCPTSSPMLCDQAAALSASRHSSTSWRQFAFATSRTSRSKSVVRVRSPATGPAQTAGRNSARNDFLVAFVRNEPKVGPLADNSECASPGIAAAGCYRGKRTYRLSKAAEMAAIVTFDRNMPSASGRRQIPSHSRRPICFPSASAARSASGSTKATTA